MQKNKSVLHRDQSRLKGVLLVLLSSLFFALGTASVKLATADTLVSGRTIAFARFSLGMLVVGAYVWARRIPLRPVSPRFVAARAIFNATAVVFLFSGLQFTTVTNANMLNMTYPVFVFVLAPFVNKERAPRVFLWYLGATMVGILLVVGGGGSGFATVNVGDLFAFASAITAGFAITSLREARKHDSTLLILFYLSLIGTIFTGIVMIPGFVMPRGWAAVFTVAAAVLSLGGQFCLTVGFRWVTAAGGAILSASRILIAALVGAVWFADPLTPMIIGGGLLIVISLIGVSRAGEQESVAPPVGPVPPAS
ncbi:MAG: DMT family transporter [Spirochaeta sp.]|nr:DMT family transporter [Spirochaeta sp.]